MYISEYIIFGVLEVWTNNGGEGLVILTNFITPELMLLWNIEAFPAGEMSFFAFHAALRGIQMLFGAHPKSWSCVCLPCKHVRRCQNSWYDQKLTKQKEMRYFWIPNVPNEFGVCYILNFKRWNVNFLCDQAQASYTTRYEHTNLFPNLPASSTHWFCQWVPPSCFLRILSNRAGLTYIYMNTCFLMVLFKDSLIMLFYRCWLCCWSNDRNTTTM